jgi:hypothetical protein
MNGTLIVASIGLIMTLLSGLGAPLIQGRVAAKNATAKRLEEQQESTYVEAVAYAQSIEKRLDELLEDPLLQSGDPLPPTPDDFMIRARMFLVAPAQVARAFDELTRAWEVLSWNVNENGPVDMIGNTAIFSAKRDDEDVVRVANALTRLTTVDLPLRTADPDQERAGQTAATGAEQPHAELVKCQLAQDYSRRTARVSARSSVRA